MSDTPRTDAEYQYTPSEGCQSDQCWSHNAPMVDADFARTLECELNALAARVKELEAVCNDPQALWSNWLRGTVALPAGIGDVRQEQARVRELEAERDKWKAYAGRLEEAGDSMQSAVVGEEGMPHWSWLAMAHEADLKWRTAKDAKP